MFMAHGGQKLFGWLGGGGLTGTAAMMERIGRRPARLWAAIAGLAEFGGGLLTLFGFLNPLGPLGIIAAMLVAIIEVHWAKGFWNGQGGFEFTLTNLTAALALGLTGPGAYSLDAVLGTRLPMPLTLLVGLVLIVLGAVVESRALAHPTARPT
jgi:putative oxidoreductase